MASEALLGGSIGVLAAGGFLAYAVRGRSSSVFGPSVYHGNRARAAIALTFDDGPSESTPALLRILDRHQVPATFFMCGQNVERLPAVARSVAHSGHEIGNHSDSHPRFDFCSRDFIYRELAAAQEKIVQHTGVTPRAIPRSLWSTMVRIEERATAARVAGSNVGHDWQRLEVAGLTRRTVIASPRAARGYLLPARRAENRSVARHWRNAGSGERHHSYSEGARAAV